MTVRRAPVFEVKEARPGLLRIMASADTPLQWRLVCLGKTDNITVSRNGTTYLEVPERCTVYGPDGAYTVPPSTLKTDIKLELVDQHDLSIPPSLAAFDDWAEVRSVLDEHEVNDYLEATKLTELREKRILSSLQVVTWSGSPYPIVLIVVLCITLLLALAAVGLSAVAWRRITKMRHHVTDTFRMVEHPQKQEVAAESEGAEAPAESTAMEDALHQKQARPGRRGRKKNSSQSLNWPPLPTDDAQ